MVEQLFPIVESITIYRLTSKVNLEYGDFKRSSLSTILIRVESEGFVGWGECGGRNFKFFFDPLSCCLKIAKKILGRPIDCPSKVMRYNPSCSLEKDWWSYGYNGAFRKSREAYSIALYDLIAKIKGIPAVSLLGEAKRRTFTGMPVIHVASPEAMARTANVWKNKKGYQSLKIKLGPKLCHERLEAIRKSIGDSVDLHVDFNLSLKNYTQTVALVESLDREFNLEIVEDPFRGRVSTYARLKEDIRPKLMMDSGTFWPRISAVAKKKAVDIINHHTDQQGGLDLALLISKTANDAGIEAAIGGSGLVGVNETAFQNLAAVIGLGRPCESILFSSYADPDFNGFYGIDGLNVLANGHTHKQGVIILNDQPGLGFDINEDVINENAKERITLSIDDNEKYKK